MTGLAQSFPALSPSKPSSPRDAGPETGFFDTNAGRTAEAGPDKTDDFGRTFGEALGSQDDSSADTMQPTGDVVAAPSAADIDAETVLTVPMMAETLDPAGDAAAASDKLLSAQGRVDRTATPTLLNTTSPDAQIALTSAAGPGTTGSGATGAINGGIAGTGLATPTHASASASANIETRGTRTDAAILIADDVAEPKTIKGDAKAASIQSTLQAAALNADADAPFTTPHSTPAAPLASPSAADAAPDRQNLAADTLPLAPKLDALADARARQGQAGLTDAARTTDIPETTLPSLSKQGSAASAMPALATSAQPSGLTLSSPMGGAMSGPLSGLSERLVASFIQSPTSGSVVALDRLPQAVVAVAMTSRRATLQIDPPELGRIQLDYQFESQGRTVVTLIPETEAARTALNERIATITAALQQGGAEGVEVNIGSASDFSEGAGLAPEDDASNEASKDGSSGASGDDPRDAASAGRTAQDRIVFSRDPGAPADRLHILV